MAVSTARGTDDYIEITQHLWSRAAEDALPLLSRLFPGQGSGSGDRRLLSQCGRGI